MEGRADDEWDSNPKGYKGRLLSGAGQIVVGLVFVGTFVVYAVTYGTIDNQLGNFLFGFFIISTGITGAGTKPLKSEIIAYIVESGFTIVVLGYILISGVVNYISLTETEQTQNITSVIINWIVDVLGIIFSISGIVSACLSFCD